MQRHLDFKIGQHFKKYKQVLILLGSRQVGKTTLVKKIFPKGDYFLVDNEPIKKILETYDIESYKTLISRQAKEIIIDESEFKELIDSIEEPDMTLIETYVAKLTHSEVI